MNFSIRTRFTSYFAVLSATLLLVCLAAIFQVVKRDLEGDFRNRIYRDTHILAELFKEEMRLNALDEFREEASELGLIMRVLDENGKVFFLSRMWMQSAIIADAPVLKAEEDHWATVVREDATYTVLSHGIVVPGHPGFVLQVAAPQEILQTVKRTVIQWTLVLLPLMIGLGVLVGLIFSSRALAPLESLRRRAEAIRPDDLSARLEPPPVRDEIYHLTETLNRTLDRMEDAFSRMKAFTADASHELRLPLTALRGTLELALRRERTPEEYREAISDAMHDADRLARITADLMELARIDAGENAIVTELTDTAAFLDKAVSEGKRRHPQARIDLGTTVNVTFLMDSDRMGRVLANLIDNAVKYGGGTPVTVNASRKGEKLSITVQDGGSEIPAEHRERIFDRFYRAEKSRSREAGGSGLGLAISRALVQLHGGSLELLSSTTSGSVFEILLPIRGL